MSPLQFVCVLEPSSSLANPLRVTYDKLYIGVFGSKSCAILFRLCMMQSSAGQVLCNICAFTEMFKKEKYFHLWVTKNGKEILQEKFPHPESTFTLSETTWRVNLDAFTVTASYCFFKVNFEDNLIWPILQKAYIQDIELLWNCKFYIDDNKLPLNLQ